MACEPADALALVLALAVALSGVGVRFRVESAGSGLVQTHFIQPSVARPHLRETHRGSEERGRGEGRVGETQSITQVVSSSLSKRKAMNQRWKRAGVDLGSPHNRVIVTAWDN